MRGVFYEEGMVETGGGGVQVVGRQAGSPVCPCSCRAKRAEPRTEVQCCVVLPVYNEYQENAVGRMLSV